MNKNGPIVVIEDDADDQEIIQGVFKRLNYKNEVLFFFDPEEALDYINQEFVSPFLILSDINMPKLSGMDLKKKISTDAALQVKCIPYLFFTTSASKNAVIEAYSMSAQGFFIKENTDAEIEKTISIIIQYWQRCYSPNQFAGTSVPESHVSRP